EHDVDDVGGAVGCPGRLERRPVRHRIADIDVDRAFEWLAHLTAPRAWRASDWGLPTEMTSRGGAVARSPKDPRHGYCQHLFSRASPVTDEQPAERHRGSGARSRPWG